MIRNYSPLREILRYIFTGRQPWRAEDKAKSLTALRIKDFVQRFCEIDVEDPAYSCRFATFCKALAKHFFYIDATLIGKMKLDVTDSDLIGRHTCRQKVIEAEAFFVEKETRAAATPVSLFNLVTFSKVLSSK